MEPWTGIARDATMGKRARSNRAAAMILIDTYRSADLGQRGKDLLLNVLDWFKHGPWG